MQNHTIGAVSQLASCVGVLSFDTLQLRLDWSCLDEEIRERMELDKSGHSHLFFFREKHSI